MDRTDGDRDDRDDGGDVDDAEAPRTSDPLAPDSDPEDLLGEMLAAGVLREDDAGDLFLADAFADAWTDEMERLRAFDHADLIAATAQAVPFEATGERAYGGIRVEGEAGVAWLRPANAIADVAAVLAMDDFGVPAAVQAPAATPLRLFTPECPVCGGGVESRLSSDGYADEIPGQGSNRRVLACVDCGAEVHELAAPVDGEAEP
ncbi:hypothetical protein [Halobaculum lipolyticum]|uniref:DUF8054 domain-containing protein n=1 Tax=Halobaculum lipolyticum TaxID=3032001 RepID=A0ABD5WDU6_9EURY|nr:hypothetical protein [Halobaculum sp. DT31]